MTAGLQDSRRPHNGDGFGLGYYTSPSLGPAPCIFTSTIPAWNCINLLRLSSKTASNLIFAHVRATTEGSLSDSNCHPFHRNSLMFMHNGNIGGWRYVKRSLAMGLQDRWFNNVGGNTDSEWAFALFLDVLDRMGYDPDSAALNNSGFGHAVLRKAVLATIKSINALIAKIPDRIRKEREEGLDCRSLLNFAITDGHSVVCTRYVSSMTDEAASLYWSSGTSWQEDQSMEGRYRMERRDKGADIVLVASEPLTFERDDWVIVPTNSILTIHKQAVMIHPIMDEYYNPNPSYIRSTGFAVSKGLDATEEKERGE
ncbi:MAG: hypothetical protein Q9201_000114 [Fulgogasparrea decipioides]